MKNTRSPGEESLDPENWELYRDTGYQMVDDMLAFLKDVRSQPVWTKPPPGARAFLQEGLPRGERPLPDVYRDFLKNIVPYRKGNIHPRYFSWVEGTGSFSGALADFLASSMNSNLGIGDHSAVYVEQQVLNWCKQLMGYPSSSAGTFTSGGSVANITALIVARNAFDKRQIRKKGLKNSVGQLVVYCSTETHNCIFKAVETIGVGTDNLRKIPVDKKMEIDLTLLRNQIDTDKKNGLIPFCLVGNAGTVNTGAVDPLSKMIEICREEKMWFHVDGAIGALLNILPEYQEILKSMTEADSIAFDLHKWLYVNYDAGCVLIRDGESSRSAFIQEANYLAAHERGLAAGPESFSNFGLELSRPFRSLKIWMSLQEHGIDKYARLIRQNIQQACYTGDRIEQTRELELLTPVSLNIVCFRFNPGGLPESLLNELNKELMMRLQEKGIAAPSYTFIRGRYAIRMSITNHRTITSDLEAIIENTIILGNQIIKENEKYGTHSPAI
jgi:aromatic-L-amino-acid decarboxylase